MATVMLTTERDRIAHLLRRFGYGASPRELNEYLPLGEKGTLRKLLDFGAPQDTDPLRFIWPYSKEEDIQPGTWRFRPWWIAQMIATDAPLRERLTLFWHDHFAVSDGKVEDGLMMLHYMKALRQDPVGKFADILRRAVTTPAFLKYLDVRMTSRTKPNENFAREVLELYTVGIGNYSETDIREASRALTGWSWLNTYYEVEGSVKDKMTMMADQGMTFSAFAVLPDLHDPTEKTILGRKNKYDGFELLNFLAERQETARFICKKLWEHFVYKDPEPKVMERLVGAYRKADGEIKPVLEEMTKLDEFWGPKAIGTRVKSPFDLITSIMRPMGQHHLWTSELKPDEPWNKPIPKQVMDEAAGVGYWLFQMGFNVLYPDDVDGWEWGTGWLSPSVMPHRTKFNGIRMFYEEKKDTWAPDAGLKPLIAEMKNHKDKDEHAFTDAFLEFFDARVSAESAQAMRNYFTQRNYKGMFENDSHAGWILSQGINLLCGSPGFNVS